MTVSLIKDQSGLSVHRPDPSSDFPDTLLEGKSQLGQKGMKLNSNFLLMQDLK